MNESEERTETRRNKNEEIENENDASANNAEVQSEEEIPAVYEEADEEELINMLIDRDQAIEALQTELQEAKDARLRKAAELDNYRKRVQRERSKIYETAKANAVEDFLSVSDDLTRTLEASEDLDVNDTFLEGVELVADKFEEVLKKQGVERIDETGVPFDVDIHDALMRQKSDDEDIDSDVVLEVVENGYKIGDRTIRHAKVIVSE